MSTGQLVKVHDVSHKSLLEARKDAISLGATANLICAIIGSGILTLPLTISMTGVGLGVALMTLVPIVMWYVCNVLRECCEYTKEDTYVGVGRHLFGAWMETCVDSTQNLYSFGACVGYLIVLGDQLLIVYSLIEKTIHIHPLPPWMVNRSHLLSLVTIALILPLTLLPSMKSLQFTSFLGVACTLFIVAAVFVHMPFQEAEFCESAAASSYNCVQGTCVVESVSWQAEYHSLDSCETSCEGASNPDNGGEITWMQFGGVWQSLPLLTFAFNCTTNFIPIFTEMKRKRAGRVQTTVFFAQFTVFVLHILCALGGYLAFCDRVCPNILDCYPTTDILALIARVAMILKLVLTFPFFTFQLRLSVEKRYGLGLVSYVVLTLSLVVSTLVVAIYFDRVDVVLSLTGAVAGSLLIFVFPGMFCLKMSQPATHLENRLVETNHQPTASSRVHEGYLLIVVGLIFMVVSPCFIIAEALK